MKMSGKTYSLILLVSLLFGVTLISNAQYFGRNKARYQSFDFKVLKSPNFEVYHYMNDSSAKYLVDLSERWYEFHQSSFKDTIRFKNPLIFYNNHAEFQQTGAIRGLISVGTGGVTEGLKNRVVMPVMETWAQTDHVLGHELVHAFQYNLLKNEEDTLSFSHLRNVPLWMVEGLAEYLSIGRKDANTSMWMRDAVLHDDIPSIKDLSTNPKYFPYRYGQAFWAFIGGVWGDEKVIDLYKNTLRYGMKIGVDTTLGIDLKSLSGLWQDSQKNYYSKFLSDSVDHPFGVKVVGRENGGRINVAPSISPSGKHIVFLSEKDLFSVDIYLSETSTGKILRKLSAHSGRNSHIDALSYVESAGSWSPDGSHFAFVIFSKGKAKLAISNIWEGGAIEEIDIPGIGSISNPSWSPWGNVIAFTGLKNGMSDIFIYNLGNGQVEQITEDIYSDIHPSWSSDGSKITFSSDRKSIIDKRGSYKFNIAIVDILSRDITNLPVFEGANNMNPVFTDLGQVVFLSDFDGFRNIFRYDIANDRAYKLTDVFTGVSGITQYSPALSYSFKSGILSYSYYSKGGYEIYTSHIDDFPSVYIENQETRTEALTLAPGIPVESGTVVQNKLETINDFESIPADSTSVDPYKPKFKLDYIGNTGVGASYSTYGIGMAGAVSMLFSDILGNNQLYTAIGINGEVYDFGGQVAYINQKKRISWGASASHLPYRMDYVGYSIEELSVGGDSTILVENFARDVIRIFEDQTSLFAYFPISTTRRIEWGGSYSYYSYRWDRFNNYYYNGWYIGERREKLESPDSYGLWRTSVAFVGDNSFFGIAAPLKGHRFRVDFSQYGGIVKYHTHLIDFRQYFYLKPFSIAFRGYFYGRYGRNSDSQRLSPMFLGHPYFIRGYDDIFFNSYNGGRNLRGINDLYGNKLIVTNLELRFPFTGPERLSLIKSRLFLTDLNLFIDAGTILNVNNTFIDPESTTTKRNPLDNIIVSTGVSVRVNLFGQLIIEPYYAFPWQRSDVNPSEGVFGLNFIPGW